MKGQGDEGSSNSESEVDESFQKLVRKMTLAETS